MEEMKEDFVNILRGNEYLIERFVHNIYGSPYLWDGGEHLIIKGYPGFKIETKIDLSDGEYKTRVIFSNINEEEKKEFKHIARTKGFSVYDIDKLSEPFEKRNDYLRRLEERVA